MHGDGVVCKTHSLWFGARTRELRGVRTTYKREARRYIHRHSGWWGTWMINMFSKLDSSPARFAPASSAHPPRWPLLRGVPACCNTHRHPARVPASAGSSRAARHAPGTAGVCASAGSTRAARHTPGTAAVAAAVLGGHPLRRAVERAARRAVAWRTGGGWRGGAEAKGNAERVGRSCYIPSWMTMRSRYTSFTPADQYYSRRLPRTTQHLHTTFVVVRPATSYSGQTRQLFKNFPVRACLFLLFPRRKKKKNECLDDLSVFSSVVYVLLHVLGLGNIVHIRFWSEVRIPSQFFIRKIILRDRN